MGKRAHTLIAMGLLAACGKPANPAGPGAGGFPPVGVHTVVLAPTQVVDSTEYLGTLKGRRSITIQPQVDGQLVKVFVKSGDVVEAGAPLMQIDPARQQAAVSSAQATRAARLASLAYAKSQLERVQRLYDDRAVSKQELDQAKATYDSAQADVNALDAQLRQNQVQLDYHRIVAPMHGVVGDIPVRVGDRVTSQTILTTLDDNHALEAYVSVPNERAAQLKLGMEVQLSDTAGVAHGVGHVTFISPQVSRETQSILIKCDVPPDAVDLRDEQLVRARVVWATHPGITVPALSIMRLNGQTFVFVAENADGKLVAKQRAVQLGDLSADSFVVVSGLKPGEKVVTTGLQKLRDGAPIAEGT